MRDMISDSGASFKTTGDGLRGCPVLIMDRDDGTIRHSRVYSNTATRIELDTNFGTSPDQFDAYWIGAVPLVIESGDLTFGNPRIVKSLHYVDVEFEPGSRGVLAFFLASDPPSTTETNWKRAGYIPLTARGWFRLPLSMSRDSSGRVIRYKIVGTAPGQPVNITHLGFKFDYAGDYE